ncbi:MAG TPA: hypothetical protein VF502_01990 [Stellaceae bacterium]
MIAPAIPSQSHQKTGAAGADDRTVLFIASYAHVVFFRTCKHRRNDVRSEVMHFFTKGNRISAQRIEADGGRLACKP